MWTFDYRYKTKGVWSSRNTSTKFEVNLRMLSTLKYTKPIWSMKPEAKFETLILGHLEILVALFKRQIGQVPSKSNKVLAYHSWSIFPTFVTIWKWRHDKTLMDKLINILFQEKIDSWNHNIFISGRFEFDNLNIKIVQIVLDNIGRPPRKTWGSAKSQRSRGSGRIFWKSTQHLMSPYDMVLEG